jgi:hypothetical protein
LWGALVRPCLWSACGARRTPIGLSFEPLVSCASFGGVSATLRILCGPSFELLFSKSFGARRQALFKSFFRGPSRACTFEAASDPSSRTLEAHRGVRPLSPVRWDPRGLFLRFRLWTRVSHTCEGVAHVAFQESTAHAFLGDVKVLRGGSRFYHAVMMAPSRARGDFGTVGPRRRPSH